MAKSTIYLEKLEKYKRQSVTGMRLKMAMYNAVHHCHSEGIQFPYQEMLERYCIPEQKEYIEDRKYYIIRGKRIIETERTIGEVERFFGKLAEKTGGKLVYSKSREPVLLLDGMLLVASKVKDGAYTEEYQEDFSVPFELYPRIINAADGAVLVETAEGVTEWQTIPK